MSGLESEFRRVDSSRVLGSTGAGLGMGFVGTGDGYGGDFGGELKGNGASEADTGTVNSAAVNRAEATGGVPGAGLSTQKMEEEEEL